MPPPSAAIKIGVFLCRLRICAGVSPRNGTDPARTRKKWSDSGAALVMRHATKKTLNVGIRYRSRKKPKPPKNQQAKLIAKRRYASGGTAARNKSHSDGLSRVNTALSEK